ncbi:flavodoxin [Enterocloster bolteae]|uniref:flavodoxin n=1 Tax=Enterocloster bolteae TaxID=208479 RepID=UPI0028DD30CC|nr:hypothetical protein [Enterocloster bolteae]
MKKSHLTIAVLVLGLSMTACQNSTAPTRSGDSIIAKETAVVENQLSSGILIAYLPHETENTQGSAEAVADVETAANMIGEVTGGSLFNLAVEDSYTEDYGTVFLGISSQGDSMEDLKWFLEQNDLSGKTIIPFGIAEAGSLEETVNQLYEWEPEAEFLDGLFLSNEDSSGMQPQVNEWLSGLGYNK